MLDNSLSFYGIWRKPTSKKTDIQSLFFMNPPSMLRLSNKNILQVSPPPFGLPKTAFHWLKTY